MRRTMPLTVALIAAVFFVFVFVHMLRSIHGALTPSLATEVVHMGNMDVQRSVSGMIVRYEEVVYAPRDGRISWAISEGDRVRRGVHVASIQNTDHIQRIADEITSHEDEIMELNRRRHFAESDAAVQRTNANLRSAINSGMHNFSTLNMAELNALQERIDQVVYNRNQMIISDGRDAVGDPGRMLENSIAQLDLHSEDIYATTSGIMFPIIDGQEQEVTPANMRDLTRDEVNFVVDHNIIVQNRDVVAGDPIFKLVSNIWYIVAYMPTEMVQGFEYNQDRTVFIHNRVTDEYEPMVMRIHHIEHHHTESMVIFRTNRNVLDFLNQRNISIRTTDYISRGLKVSNSAIVTRRFIRIPTTHVHGAGNDLVHVMSHYGLRQVSITPAEITDDYVDILEEIHPELIMGDTLLPQSILGDNFVINESVVRVVHGVYQANFGYASFIPVSLEGDLSEIDGYTLLDPSRNTSLRQFDTIVTDATQVTHGEIIR